MLELWISGEKRKKAMLEIALCLWQSNFASSVRNDPISLLKTFLFRAVHNFSTPGIPSPILPIIITLCLKIQTSWGPLVAFQWRDPWAKSSSNAYLCDVYKMIFFAVSHLWIANFSSCWVEACYSLSDPSGILCNFFQFPVRKWELFNHNKIILLIWPSFTCLTSLATCCSNSCLLRWNPR